VLAADGADQAAGVLVAAQVDQLEIVQQARLQLDQLDAAAQRFEDRQPLALVAGQGELLQQLVEVGHQPVAQAVAVQPGQAVQDRDEPADQLQGGLLNRQLGGGGCGAGGIRGHGTGRTSGGTASQPPLPPS
jgi:hypothetical protein